MKTLFQCEIEYKPLPHLMQLYTGFFELEKKGIISLKVVPKKTNKYDAPVINVTVNNKYKVVYDTMDGLIWINGTLEENLKHFQENYKSDFYFKRSYTPTLEAYNNTGGKLLPLGLNYNIHPDKNILHLNPTLNDKFKYIAKTNGLLKKLLKKSFFYTSDFEYFPVDAAEDRILFLTRVWNPYDGRPEASKIHREQINETRINCITACQKAFGKRFTGGLFMDDFSKKHYQSLAIPFSFTNKSSFVQAVKDHTICIATTGLHDSIGWKMGEYVAASRAIVSEPLKYQLPGNFEKDRNYYEFENADHLLKRIQFLLDNRAEKLKMMEDNFRYYNNYVKPDVMLLNTLITVCNSSN